MEQFVSGAEEVTNQVSSLKDSGSRVFVSFMLSTDYYIVIKEAISQEIIGMSLFLTIIFDMLVDK